MRIAISWNELPSYGARCIKAAIQQCPYPVDVIGTRPTVPLKGVDEILQGIRWVERNKVVCWADVDVETPDLFFQAGWYIPAFVGLGAQVRASGKPVVLLADNAWKNTPRQWMGAIKYRLSYRGQFAGVWVPGAMGVKLMTFFGVRPDRIFDGLYGTDPELFQVGPPLDERPKTFVFVGRLTNLKGIPELASAFEKFRSQRTDWKLVVFGDGECRGLVERRPGIEFRSFAQPNEVAAGLRSARFLILPTLTDNWPLVVSEAALSGCGLLLSDKVGNCSEFMGRSNGQVFRAQSADSLVQAMLWAARMDDDQLRRAGEESRRLGELFTPSRWAKQFGRITDVVRTVPAGANRLQR